jgi:YggT family protein
MDVVAFFLVNLIQVYIWVIIIGAVLSWLIAFNVINTHNRFVMTVVDTLWRLTQPALRPIRAFLPNLGGIDVSPVILILILLTIQYFLAKYFLAPPGVVSY